MTQQRSCRHDPAVALMTRRLSGRPVPDWTESVVLHSYENALADPEPPPAAELAEATQSPVPPRIVPSWLVALAVLVACGATVAASLWWQFRSRTIVVTNRVLPSYAAGADAFGCPNLSSCDVRAGIAQPLSTAARRLFPNAMVISSVSVVDSDTGRTVQTAIVLHARSGVEVSATAQCLPDGGPIPGRAAALPQVGPAQADFVVAGKPGCNVAVSAQIPRSVRVPVTELLKLATDPSVQLSR
jgi:hypothetical protein